MGKGDVLKSVVSGLKSTLGGVGSAAVMDMYNQGDVSPFSDPDKYFDNLSYERLRNFALNTAIGSAGTHLIRKGIAAGKDGGTQAMLGMGTLIGLPTKDLLFNAQHLPGKIDKVLDATHTELKNKPTSDAYTNGLSKEMNTTLKLVGGGALGLGALGLAAKVLKRDKTKKEVGRIRYRIPGKNGDPATEAVVELPLDSAKLSPTMIEGIETNIRRQAVRNIKANMRKRDPQTGKLIPLTEWEAKYGSGVGMLTKMSGLLVRNSAEGKPTGPAVTHTATDDFTLDDFYRLKAGGQFNTTGGTVKVASRAFHEGAGSVLTGSLGALAGGYLGSKLYKSDPKAGKLAGTLLGAVTPLLLGRGMAHLQEEKRSKESQDRHDEASPALEYLLPGYAHYQHERRRGVEKAKAMEVAGASFAATGMNPVAPTQDMSLMEADAADELTGREDALSHAAEDDEFYELSKAANGPAPAPAPKPAQGAATAQVRNPGSTAVQLQQKKPTSLTNTANSIQQSIQGLRANR
jgi:hypothetical protein